MKDRNIVWFVLRGFIFCLNTKFISARFSHSSTPLCAGNFLSCLLYQRIRPRSTDAKALDAPLQFLERAADIQASAPPHLDRRSGTSLATLQPNRLRDTGLLVRGEGAGGLGIEAEGVCLENKQ